MQVFLDLVPVHVFRRRKLRQGGKFFLALSGISISTAGGEVTIEPIYLPLIAIDRRGSLVYIEIGRGRRRILLIASSSRPHLHIERIESIQLEDCE